MTYFRDSIAITFFNSALQTTQAAVHDCDLSPVVSLQAKLPASLSSALSDEQIISCRSHNKSGRQEHGCAWLNPATTVWRTLMLGHNLAFPVTSQQ